MRRPPRLPGVTDPNVYPSRDAAVSWIAKAVQDLAVADLVVASEVGVNWAACFHAQQAAEKALKAVLVLHGIDFPRSHALERLAALLPPRDGTHFDRKTLAELSPWAVAGRYPEDIENPSLDETTLTVGNARRIVDIATRITNT